MSLTPDKNFYSIADQVYVNLAEETISPENPQDYDDILKISGSSDVSVKNCIINPNGGNREDGVDIMRESKYIQFYNTKVGCGNKYGFTIKGGSDCVSLVDVVITNTRGKEGVDIDIGNYASVCPDAKTGTVTLDNVTRDGYDGVVTVRVGWAKRPVIKGGNVKVLFWQSLGLKIYVLCKRITNRIP